jgi:hypothetical protein
MSEREGEERLQYAHKCSRWPLFYLSTRATQVYIAPSPKLVVMGQLPLFRAHADGCNTSLNRPHKNPNGYNGYKNVRTFKKDLRMVCPSRLDDLRYIKLSQNEVLLTLHIC